MDGCDEGLEKQAAIGGSWYFAAFDRAFDEDFAFGVAGIPSCIASPRLSPMAPRPRIPDAGVGRRPSRLRRPESCRTRSPVEGFSVLARPCPTNHRKEPNVATNLNLPGRVQALDQQPYDPQGYRVLRAQAAVTVLPAGCSVALHWAAS